jgi:hypothetical protein
MLETYSDNITADREGKFKFVECVTWADDSKRRGGGWQSNWHFDDIPFVGDGSKESDFDFAYNAKNITAALPAITDYLSGKDVSGNVMIDTIKGRTASDAASKSLALRLLIHFMGDVHQPLHCSDRYTKDKPKGDKGGNDFALKNHYAANELHAVWDNVIYQYHATVHRPFDTAGFADFGKLATELHDSSQFSKSQIQMIDFGKMADESYKIAVHVYDDLNEGKEEILPDAYISKYAPIAKERAALAGYRLAYLIETIFGKSSNSEEQIHFLF